MNFALILFCLLVVSGAIWIADFLVFSKRRSPDAKDPWWVEYGASFFPVILLVFVLRSFVVEPFRIPSESMVPTLEVGDFILVNKYTYGIRLPVLNKKLITNSLSIIYDILSKCKNKDFVSEISNYLMTAVYKSFRIVYSANPKNQSNMFSVSEKLYSGFADAELAKSEAKAKVMASGEKVGGLENADGLDNLSITTENLNEKYPQYASSLFNLIQRAEKNIQD